MKRIFTCEYNEEEIREFISSAVADALVKFLPQIQQTSNSPPQTSDRLISRKEVARILQLSLPTIAKLQKSGVIKAVTFSGSYRYSKKHITELVNSNKKVGTG